MPEAQYGIAPKEPTDHAGAIPDQHSLLVTKSNAQLAEEEVQKKIALVDDSNHDPFLSELTVHIQNHWEQAKNNKWYIEDRLLNCLRQRKGVYSADDLKHIKQFGGSEIFMMITNVKCRAIESWIKDVLLPAGEKPWSISPTPEPEFPQALEDAVKLQVSQEVTEIAEGLAGDMSFLTPEVVSQRVEEIRKEIQVQQRREAIKEADGLEIKMNDQLTEGDFYKEVEAFIKDFATYPTAFLKGPVIRNRKVLTWSAGPDGKKKPTVTTEPRRYWQRVSPFDLYFAPGARHVNDGYAIERIRLRRSQLTQMKGVEGFSDSSIDAVLLEDRAGTLNNWLWTDQERANLEDRPNELSDPEGIIQAIEYHGWASGKELKEWGMKSNKVKSDTEMYNVQCILIDRWVIMARLNSDPLGRNPYYGTSFDMNNDSIWGIAPPELMEDCQRVCNASARAVVNNMAIASGPQVEVNWDRLKATEDSEALYPWKIWRTKSDPMGKNHEAVRFYQPNLMTQNLLLVYEQFFKQAGEQLGVPAYEHGGGQPGGAGKTAHGLSMLMSASSKIIKDAIVNIDTHVIKPAISDTFMHMMLYDDLDYDGDINIVARASEYLVIAEQLQIRRAEFLSMTNNPTDMAIIGMPGRAEILRESIKTLKLPAEDIIPDRDEMMDRQAMMEQAQVDPMTGEPIDTGMGGGETPGAIPAPGINQEAEGSSLPTEAPAPRG
jgi:hypothetical protein